MKLLASQINSEAFIDWYNLVFVHKNILFFTKAESNEGFDEIINKVINIDEDIDFDDFKIWLKERVNSVDSIPFYIVNGWKKEFKLLLKDYKEELSGDGGQVSDLKF